MNLAPRLLVLGCGYLGHQVAQQFPRHSGDSAVSASSPVTVTTRHRVDHLRALGHRVVRFDWDDSRDLPHLRSAIEQQEINRILISVSYDRRSGVDRFVSQVDHLARVLTMIADIQNQRLNRPNNRSESGNSIDVAYVSTTGVYHQTGGVWVDENSPNRPSRDGGKSHLQAEAKLPAILGDQVDWTILRLAGIYGPGRVPRAADVRAGRPIASPPDGYLNLIHVSDAARAVVAALCSTDSEKAQRQRRYCICDDAPVIRREFYEEIARQTASPPPSFIEPSEHSGVRFRSETNKRVCNRAMKRDLLPVLEFPSYREGLQSIL